jgi:hypothetical protein
MGKFTQSMLLLANAMVLLLSFGASAVLSAPVTMPADTCLSFAEIKAFRQPQEHGGAAWFDQIRNIACYYEFGEPTYGDGQVILIGTCERSSNCDENCGNPSASPTVQPINTSVGQEVTITQQDKWESGWSVEPSISWGNENSASSLILGAAKIEVKAGWKHGWGGETATQVKVGSTENITIPVCGWLVRYRYGAYRSGATGEVSGTMCVHWDEHCSIHNAWINDKYKHPIANGSQDVTVTYVIGETCAANIGSGTCNGLTPSTSPLPACPTQDEIKAACGFNK